MEELEEEYKASMGERLNISIGQITEFRDIYKKLMRVMRHISVFLYDN